MIVTEIPRLAADVFGGRAEHGALDRHPAVRRVVMSRRQETLDGKAEQDDPTVLAVEVPPGNFVHRVETGDGTDLEAHFLQLGPGAAKKLDGGADGEVEAIEAAVERGERRTNDLAAPEPSVPAVARAASRSGSGASGTTTRHAESLSVAVACGAASESGLLADVA